MAAEREARRADNQQVAQARRGSTRGSPLCVPGTGGPFR
jgi:hypothetical protein